MSGQKLLKTTSSNPIPHLCPGSCTSSAIVLQKDRQLGDTWSRCWFGDFSILPLSSGLFFWCRAPSANRAPQPIPVKMSVVIRLYCGLLFMGPLTIHPSIVKSEKTKSRFSLICSKHKPFVVTRCFEFMTFAMLMEWRRKRDDIQCISSVR